MLYRGTCRRPSASRRCKLPELQIPLSAAETSILNSEHIDARSFQDPTPDRTKRAKISLLGEYGTRLIADLVTGKLDVPKAAVRLPVEAAEPEREVEEEAKAEEGIENVDLIAAAEQAGDAE